MEEHIFNGATAFKQTRLTVKHDDADKLSDEETAKRLERALQRAVNMSPKPHEPPKGGTKQPALKKAQR